ncbi:restriction endonuclease subunit S [Pseudoalteromonas aliena]|uniref:Type I restriction enzyme, S subunit n=1 Tax=Pseudoalteromonas aliena SW19 TaxID=1314866 RepID=A0ABR9E4P8_9GAMM|nr:restriction endonuclease subunit S [Pseudoalteromonas aliena]MBE0361313.1 type I restriction enzyme, S subunit [Pseudoalteromonas aliena SW19]
MDFNTETLESLCELVVDCPHSTPKWTDSGIIVLRNQNIKNGVLDLSNPSFTNEEDYQKRVKRAIPRAGDIVITREAPMGDVCIIPEGLKCCLGQRQVLLRPRNEICGEYLFWALQSPYVQHQISWNEGTGTTVSNVRIPVLKALMIPRFPKHEKQSAKILSVLASKLEINQQTNQTLEQMAQALFKSWFVDFDPVFDNLLASVDFNVENLETSLPDELKQKAQRRLAALNSLHNATECKASLIALAHELQAQLPTKEATQSAVQVSEKAAETPVKPNFSANPKILTQHANTHAHFPSEFEHNEQLGWIPKGWKSGTFKDVADGLSGYAFKGKDFSEFGCAVLKIKNISTDRTVTISDVNRVLPEVVDNLHRFLLNDGDIIMAMTGAGSVGRFGVVATENNEPYYLNQRVCKLSPKLKNGAPFLFSALNQPGLEEVIFKAAQGSGQPNISVNGILATTLLIPSLSTVELFSRLLKDTYDRKITLRKECYKLVKLRDTLLPKLISGELQIPDVATDDETVD